MDSYNYIGTRARKKDGRDKVTGRAIYCQDLVLPRMLHGKILYSLYPHAKILAVRTEKARKVPGVRTILTGEDIPHVPIGFIGDNVPLKKGKVRATSDEVAAVAAETREAAEEALDLIEVEYEELPMVMDAEEALEEGSPLVHDNRESNRIDEIARIFRTGNLDAGFAESEIVLEQTFHLQYVSHVCMGASYAAAAFDSSGRLTVWSNTQVPFILQKDLSRALGISGRDIKIVQPIIGGGFGKALDMYPHEVIAVLLAKESRRPVSIAFDREEELAAAPKRQPAKIVLKQGVAKDGTLRARKVDILLNAGAYVSWGPLSSWTMVQTFGSFYKVPNIEFRATPVYTNGPVCSAMRGYGNPQAHFALESQMDCLAEELRMDPIEFRKLNGNDPFVTTAQGIKITSCGFKECLDRAVEMIGWKEKRGQKASPAPNKVRGVGLAGMWHVGGGSRIYNSDGAGAIVKIDDFGCVTLFTGASELGQGSDTGLSLIVSEVLGVPIENVTLVNDDTDTTPWDVGSHASRTMFICGQAAKLAAEDARAQLFGTASEMLEAAPEDLVAEHGMVFVRGAPSRGIPYEKVVRSRHFRSQGDIVIGKGFYDPGTTLLSAKDSCGNVSAAYTFAAQAVEVEVDTETGRVSVVDAAAVHDVGKVINPMGLEGQIEGGMVMGMGYGLFEEIVVEDGRVTNPSFLDYHVCTSLDVPPIKVGTVETNDPEGPYGLKGVGECAAIAVAPAIANAIYDAVGVRVCSLPITPQKVYDKLKEKGATK